MKPLSVYVHIPFCVKKCVYCDFLSFSGMDAYFDAYTEKLTEEIKTKAAGLSDYKIKTIFVGGGTPTLLSLEQLSSIINTIKKSLICSSEMEITIEANPETVDANSLGALKLLADRISFGFQSDKDRLLADMGRIHNKQSFENSFNYARYAGFTNINADIMFSFPSQTIKDFEETLDYIAGKRPEHISCYGLILEEGTALYNDVLKGLKDLENDEAYLSMYHLAKKKLKAAGYRHYEISNFALPGYECKHNIVYWRCMEYVGFGLGASSYIASVRFRNESELRKYLNGNFMLRYEEEEIPLNDKISEFMFMGLRMTDGVYLSDFKDRFGISPKDVYGGTLSCLQKQGLIEADSKRINLTSKGIDVSNYVFAALLI